MKRILSGFVILLMLALVAGACGGGGADTGNSPDAVSPESGVLRIPGPEPQTLDPALAGDVASAFYVNEIFGGLLTWLPESAAPENVPCYNFSGRIYCLAPDIAENIPEPQFNSDGTVSYTFELRHNVYFHRGRQVTAQDFKYSFERALDPRTGSTTAELYLWDIMGARDMARSRVKTADGIGVVNDFTLKLTTERYNAVFLLKLTYPTSFVVDKEQVRGNQTWFNLPNGTGPFRCVECRVSRSKVVLEPNKSYHLGAPKLSRVDISFAGGSAPTQYADGVVDVSGVALVEIEDVRSPGNPLSKELHETPELATFYVAFNTEKAPFDDPLVRRAFAMAIDKDLIARSDLKDAVDVAQTIVPPSMPGYTPPADAAIPFDPARAKELLASSRYGKNFPEVTLLATSAGASPGSVTQRIVAMWEQNLGVKVNVQQLGDFAQFIATMRRGDYQMTQFGWVADYPDPEDFLDLKFHSQRSRANNETRYANAEVDQLLEQARGEKDSARRMELYQQAERLILADAPWIPLFHEKNIMLVKPYVQGYEPPPMAIPFLRYVEVK